MEPVSADKPPRAVNTADQTAAPADQPQPLPGQDNLLFAQLQAVLDHCPNPFLLLTADGTILYANQAFADQTGGDRPALAGQPLYDQFSHEQAALWRHHLDQVRVAGAPQHFPAQTDNWHADITLIPLDAADHRRAAPIAAYMVDTSKHKHIEALLKARLRLSETANTVSLNTLLQKVLDEAETLTKSQIGFFHFLDEAQQNLSLQAWSTNTLRSFCRTAGFEQHYPVQEAGVWVDCIRERRPVIHNHYATLSHRRGLPPGHAAIEREVVVPIVRNGHIVAIFGIGNKQTEYNQQDVDILTTLGDMVWDIVLRKQDDELLAESARNYQEIFNSTSEAIFIHDADTGAILDANEMACTMFGFLDRQAMLGLTVDRLTSGIAPYSGQDACRLLARCQKGESQVVEWLARRNNGQTFWVEVSLKTSTIGGRGTILAVVRDIDERKRLENVRTFLARAIIGDQNEPFFQTLARYLAENLDMDFVCIDRLEGDGLTATTVAVWHDGRFEDNVSYSLQDTPCGEVVGKEVCCFPASVRRLFPRDLVLEDLAAESYVGVTLWDHCGQPIGLIAVISRKPLQNLALAESILKLVAGRAAGELERMQTQERLRTTLERLRIILARLYPGILVMSEAEQVEFVNQSFCNLFHLAEQPAAMVGMDRAELIRRMAEVYVDPPAAIERIETVLAERKPIREEEVAIKGERTILRDFIPIEIEGRQYGRLWHYYDITDHKKAVTAARESEQRFRSYFEMGLIGMAMITPDGEWLHYNDRLCEILGYSREELAKTTWATLSLKAEWTDDQRRLRRILNHTSENYQSEKHFIHKDGGIVWSEVSVSCIRNEDGTATQLVVMVQDITLKKQAEEKAKQLQAQLIQAQKLEAIGTLAGGIAHDFNNILAAVIGYADMAKDTAPEGSALAHDLEQVLKAGHRAKDLVKQILAFSRETDTKPIHFFPSIIVREVIQLLRPTLPSTIAIGQRIDQQAGPVLIDPTQLHQILMNLCTNAFHAMEENGGRLDISLKTCQVEAAQLPASTTALPGDYVQLTVADTGTGIAPAIRNRIFDPFFTTKAMGKGTGMGLSIVHGIVSSRDGFITVDSTPGAGTTFNVFLPLAIPPGLAEEEHDELTGTRGEHILFVDDEEVLTSMTANMLQRLGYRVTVRSSSLEALTTFQNHPDQFDLVITDQTMPGMTGMDLARRMLQIRPDMPIILCTGFSALVTEEKVKSLGVKALALKPLTKKDLAILTRKVLNPS